MPDSLIDLLYLYHCPNINDHFYFHAFITATIIDSFRAYIGLEYECPRGHRFIHQGPEKISKPQGGTGGPKEGGNKLVTSDMLLHVPCTCRTTKPPLGQLIRAFIVTPEAPLYVQLNPRVRPGAHPVRSFIPSAERIASPSPRTASGSFVFRILS
ncbi:hypothetical protein BSL78_17060 [Apostichopus japonicus]|uniref:Nonsense-mediated mRNA decay factor SMG8 n=1 Tax=Stichopus japonicus TaxID=307972 RepID=A0A2G8KDI3_STIJA|nr:hypothetical protein BSL78_17060 [Apostichopus japonicus]